MPDNELPPRRSDGTASVDETTLDSLLAQRVELQRCLADVVARTQGCLQAIRHVEETIWMLAPGLDWTRTDDAPHSSYTALFQHGDVTRQVRAILQEAGCPVSTAEIVTTILDRHGAPRLSKRDRKRLFQTVFAALTMHMKRGEVVRKGRIRRHASGAAGSMLWVWASFHPEHLHAAVQLCRRKLV